VTFDEVVAVIHGVPGVVAVDVDRLCPHGAPSGSPPEPRIFPDPARVQPDGSVTPASLLTLDEAGLALSKMP
jgi:hypothetical protein